MMGKQRGCRENPVTIHGCRMVLYPQFGRDSQDGHLPFGDVALVGKHSIWNDQVGVESGERVLNGNLSEASKEKYRRTSRDLCGWQLSKQAKELKMRILRIFPFCWSPSENRRQMFQ